MRSHYFDELLAQSFSGHLFLRLIARQILNIVKECIWKILTRILNVQSSSMLRLIRNGYSPLVSANHASATVQKNRTDHVLYECSVYLIASIRSNRRCSDLSDTNLLSVLLLRCSSADHGDLLPDSYEQRFLTNMT